MGDVAATVAKVGLALTVAGACLAALAVVVGGPFVGAAVAVFGVAGVFGGVHSAVTRSHRTGESGSSHLVREHTGVAAIIFGLSFIVVGLVLAVAGVLHAIGEGDALWSWAGDNAGLVAIVGGGWVCLLGFAMVTSRWRFVDTSTSWWQRLPGMAVGLYVIVMGLLTIAIGRSLVIDPPESDELLETVLDTLAGWLGQ